MKMHWETLSTREIETLELASNGLGDSEIASELQIAETSVRTYWARLRFKLGGITRNQAVAAYRRRISAVQTAELENYRSLSKLAAFALLEESEDRLLIKSCGSRFADLLGSDAYALAGRSLGTLLPAAQMDRLSDLIHDAKVKGFAVGRSALGSDPSGVTLITTCTKQGHKLLRLFHAPDDCSHCHAVVAITSDEAVACELK